MDRSRVEIITMRNEKYMTQSNFAVAGLGVMGRMVALNIERNGFPVIAYNRGAENADRMREVSKDRNIMVTRSIQEMAVQLDRPRRVLVMTTAGAGADAVIGELKKIFEPGDIIIDGGNAHYPDTDRRQAELDPSGIHFIGCGISGGEQGALWGPSIMPGGHREGYDHIAPVLTKIAAQTDDGPCVTHVGAGSAGHYVKMVHNGIEYGIMQIICEIYDVLRKSASMATAEIQAVFDEWRESEVSGFLVEIAADCLARQDESSGRPLVEVILDTAGQKGTGKWTAQSGLDLGVPIPTLSMAVEARILSGLKPRRVAASKVLAGPSAAYRGDRGDLLDSMYRAFHLAKVACYAQGIALIQRASKEFEYGVNLAEVARIWKGGCIIRSKLLDPIKKACQSHPALDNLLTHEAFRGMTNANLPHLRKVVGLAAETGVPVTCLGATLAYVDSYRSEFLPANLLQALRDNFGAHTYRRLDREGDFHTDWVK